MAKASAVNRDKHPGKVFSSSYRVSSQAEASAVNNTGYWISVNRYPPSFTTVDFGGQSSWQVVYIEILLFL